MKSRIIRTAGAVLLSLSLLAFAGCGGGGLYGSGGGSTGSSLITKIAITPTTSTIAVNGTQTYMVTATLGNGSMVNGVQFTWTSSNPNVATVNTSGMATAVSTGTATITASVQYGGTGCAGPYCMPGSGNATTVTSNAATLTVSANGMATGTVASGTSSMQGSMQSNTGTMNGMYSTGGMNMMPIGHSVQGAVVSLKDSQGQTVVTMTDGNGRYQLSTSGLNGSFLLKAQDNQGHALYSFANAAGVINITPITDLMVRMWYGAHGTTADAAFTNPAAHPAPQAAELATLNKTLTGFLADSLTHEGLNTDKFDLIATPFTIDGAGFDHILDNTTISNANGEIVVHDGLSDNEAVISFDQTHSAIQLTSISHASTNAATSNSTVVLK